MSKASFGLTLALTATIATPAAAAPGAPSGGIRALDENDAPTAEWLVLPGTGEAAPDCSAGAGWSSEVRLRSCRLRWTGEGTPDLDALPEVPGAIVERDARIVSPAVDFNGALLDDDPRSRIAELAGDLLDRARALMRFPRSQLASLGAAGRSSGTIEVPNVPLAVIDSVRGGTPIGAELSWPSRSMHGSVITETVQSMGISGGAQSLISTYLALPRIWTPEQELEYRDDYGGHYGTLGDVTAALEEVVRDQALRKDPRVVVNLSLGWPADPAGEREAEAGIRALLEEIVCRGGVVITASGNRRLPGETGAFYPAAWSADAASCGSFLAPLVYSIGALGMNGRPAGVSRPGAKIFVYAPGFAIAGREYRSSFIDTSEGPVDIYQQHNRAIEVMGTPSEIGMGHNIYVGSSIAAARVSGLAAKIWGLAPQLSGSDVMDLIAKSANEIDPKIEARAIDVCAALLDASTGNNPELETACAVPRRKRAIAALAAGVETRIDGEPSPPVRLTAAPKRLPFELDPSLAAEAVPQPGQPICSVCRPTANAKADDELLFFGKILDDAGDYRELHATFVLRDREGNEIYASVENLEVGGVFSLVMDVKSLNFERYDSGWVELYYTAPGDKTMVVSISELLPPE